MLNKLPKQKLSLPNDSSRLLVSPASAGSGDEPRLDYGPRPCSFGVFGCSPLVFDGWQLERSCLPLPASPFYRQGRIPSSYGVALTELRFYFVLLEQNKNSCRTSATSSPLRGRSNGVEFLPSVLLLGFFLCISDFILIRFFAGQKLPFQRRPKARLKDMRNIKEMIVFFVPRDGRRE